ncbi:MAG: GTPase HflX [Alphaproteobacteria bacterium]|nr:GTPase HflX [Alphaproteobacteria bacterium]
MKEAKSGRSPAAALDEMVLLAQAVGLAVVHSEAPPVREIRPATYLGAGAVERLGALIAEKGVAVAVLACALSPLQQRNLERAWHIKVIDKTALILEIFGARARTREGILQVKLAHLTYARSRLVRSWTHLERQRGGAGFMGGPGETQIELDRRRIDDDIVRIKRELAEVQKTRALHRRARQRVPYPVVALVGYTNAGKSTLFNRLTRADVLARDMLFATLDPTMRRLKLPGGTIVILSDTVGFISDLPTELVMAFRATLEEVSAADVIVHVRDASHPDAAAQKADVEKVLADLGLEQAVHAGLIEALNKIDLLDADERARLRTQKTRSCLEWPVSAKTGEGVDDLLRCVEQYLTQGHLSARLRIPVERGDILARVYRDCVVLSRRDAQRSIRLDVKAPPEKLKAFEPFVC